MSQRDKIIQVPRNRLFYRAGQSSIRLQDVLPGKVTVDLSYSLSLRKRSIRTPFVEAKVAPVEEVIPKGVKALTKIAAASVEETKMEFLKRVVDRLVEVVQIAWSSGLNVVLHSSGYDSRILSWIIKFLGYENVLFVCVGPESEIMRSILRYEGWPNEHIVTLEDMGRYYQACASFGRAWQWINGSASSLFNLLWVVMDVLHQNEIVPQSGYQVWTGYGTDYGLKGAGAKKGNLFWKYYVRSYWAYTSLPLSEKEMACPFMDSELLKIVAESSVRLGYGIREEIINYLDPQLLQFPRADQHYPSLDLQTLSRCQGDYDRSWYGSRIKVDASPRMLDHKWWSRWSTAAFCEHLLEAGYELA